MEALLVPFTEVQSQKQSRICRRHPLPSRVSVPAQEHEAAGGALMRKIRACSSYHSSPEWNWQPREQRFCPVLAHIAPIWASSPSPHPALGGSGMRAANTRVSVGPTWLCLHTARRRGAACSSTRPSRTPRRACQWGQAGYTGIPGVAPVVSEPNEQTPWSGTAGGERQC